MSSKHKVLQAQPVMAVPVSEGNQVNYNQNENFSNGGGDMSFNQGMEQNVYGDGQDGNWADDTIERSGNLFSQLDSMIAAVQTESSALDSMREKLKELDGMRMQLSSLTKRLLEADQANLTLSTCMEC